MSKYSWHHSVDILVVGSGNGALTAALCNYEMGTQDVLIIEKTDKIGGTSANSGGGIWIPCNHYAKACGAEDSIEEAREYLKHTLKGENTSQSLVDAYLENGPEMLQFLADKTHVEYQSLAHYPDYYSSLPGARNGHRSLEPAPINISVLGKYHKRLRFSHHMMRLLGKIHFTQVEAALLAAKSPGWKKLVTKLILQYIIDIPWRFRSSVSRRLCTGSAGIARLYWSLLQRNIPIWFESPLIELITENDVVIGAKINQQGNIKTIHARKAVILAAGGFESNQTMRERYLPKPTDANWSAAVGSNTGDAINAGIKIGAATNNMDGAWWCTTLCVPGEEKPRLSIMEKSFPGSCVVNAKGLRFANESQNYMAFQRQQFRAHSEQNPCAPAYHIFDSKFRRSYVVGPLIDENTKIPQRWYDEGFIGCASTWQELAEQMNIDATGLIHTIEKMNRYAASGVDEDFKRGEDEYDRYYADPSIKPNPCLAAITEPPYYAMRIDAGEFGTYGGLVTNEKAQVINESGNIIQGLYATGNSSAGLLTTYPGPGATLGPAMTFAYQAAKAINDKNHQ